MNKTHLVVFEYVTYRLRRNYLELASIKNHFECVTDNRNENCDLGGGLFYFGRQIMLNRGFWKVGSCFLEF